MAMSIIFGVFLILPLVLMGLLLFIFWIIMFVDVLTRKFKNESDKVVWILVTLLVGLVGGIIYYFMVYKNDKNLSLKWLWITLGVLLGIEVILGIIFLVSSVIILSN